jgi:hypothetical protein
MRCQYSPVYNATKEDSRTTEAVLGRDTLVGLAVLFEAVVLHGCQHGGLPNVEYGPRWACTATWCLGYCY